MRVGIELLAHQAARRRRPSRAGPASRGRSSRIGPRCGGGASGNRPGFGSKASSVSPPCSRSPCKASIAAPAPSLSGLELPDRAAAGVEPVEPGLGWADQIVLGLARRRAGVRQARDRVDAAGQHLQRIGLPGGGGDADPHRLMAMDRAGPARLQPRPAGNGQAPPARGNTVPSSGTRSVRWNETASRSPSQTRSPSTRG